MSTAQQKAISPEEFLGQVEGALPKVIPKERNRLLEHARAWAISFYEGEMPVAMEHRLESLEAQWHS
jgi:hypothetical protein